MAGSPGVRVDPATRISSDFSVIFKFSNVRVDGIRDRDRVEGVLGRERGMVDEPIMRWLLDGLRDRRVPEMVMAGWPGVRVDPSMRILLGCSVILKLSKVRVDWIRVGGEVIWGKGMVDDPTTRLPDEPREIGVPDMVTADPPGVRVRPPIIT